MKNILSPAHIIPLPSTFYLYLSPHINTKQVLLVLSYVYKENLINEYSTHSFIAQNPSNHSC